MSTAKYAMRGKEVCKHPCFTLGVLLLAAFAAFAAWAMAARLPGALAAENLVCYAYLEADEQTAGKYTLYLESEQRSGSGEGFIEIGSYWKDGNRPWANSQYARGIRTVVIGGGVRPSNTDGWFCGLTELESVDLSGLDMSNASSMNSMFGNCTNLRECSLSGLDLSSVTSMSNLFSKCTAITTIDLSGVDTKSVTDMSGMFGACEALRNVDLRDLDTDNVTTMESMFNGCKALDNIDLSSFNTAKVTNMRSMFSYCTSLTMLDFSKFPQFVTANVTNMEEMFNLCYGLRVLNISTFDVSSLGNANGCFGRVENLQCLRVGTGCVQENAALDWSGLWQGNSSLKFVLQSDRSTIFSKADAITSYLGEQAQAGRPVTLLNKSGLDSYSGAQGDQIYAIASSAGNERTLKLRSDIRTLASDEELLGPVEMNGFFPWSFESTSFTHVVVENVVKPHNTSWWFYGFKRMETFEGIENIDFSESESALSMFRRCSSLKTLDFSGVDFGALKYLGDACMDCTSLVSVSFASARAQNLNHMSELFKGCTALEHVDLNGMEALALDSISLMFEDCKALRNVTLAGLKAPNITNMTGMFTGCSALETCEIASIGTAGVTSFHAMFYGCGNLSELTYNGVDLGNVTEGTGYSAFPGNPSLFTVVLSGGAKLAAGLLPPGTWRAPDGTEFVSGETPLEVEGTYTFVSKPAAPPAEEPSEDPVYWHAVLHATGELIVDSAEIETGAGDKEYQVDTAGYERADQLPWHVDRSKITSVKIQTNDSITSTAYWFSGCTALQEANIGKLNTYELRSTAEMFSGCGALRTFKSGITGHVFNGSLGNHDMSGMFDGCTSLVDADLGLGFEPLSVARMFRGCIALESFNWPNWDTAGATNFDEMFRNCTSLKALNLTRMSTRAAQSMKRMFHGCTALEEIQFGSDFTFRGFSVSRLAGSELPAGIWVPLSGASSESVLSAEAGSEGAGGASSGSSGKVAYASDSIPNFTADTYTRVSEADAAGYTVISLFADDKDTLFTTEVELVDDGNGGFIEDTSYVLSDSFLSSEFDTDERAKASSTASAGKGKISASRIRRIVANDSAVTVLKIGRKVKGISYGAFAGSPIRTLNVKSPFLRRQGCIRGCLVGSSVKNVKVKIAGSGKKYTNDVIRAFENYAGKTVKTSG